jgi:hypothetical protein
MTRIVKEQRQSTRFSRRTAPPGSAAVARIINELIDQTPDEARDRAEIAAVASGPQQIEAGLKTLRSWRAIGGCK